MSARRVIARRTNEIARGLSRISRCTSGLFFACTQQAKILGRRKKLIGAVALRSEVLAAKAHALIGGELGMLGRLYGDGACARPRRGGMASRTEAALPADASLSLSDCRPAAWRSIHLHRPRIFACCVHTGAGGLLCTSAMQAFSARCIGE